MKSEVMAGKTGGQVPRGRNNEWAGRHTGPQAPVAGRSKGNNAGINDLSEVVATRAAVGPHIIARTIGVIGGGVRITLVLTR